MLYRIHSTGTVEELITDQIRDRSVSEDPTEESLQHDLKHLSADPIYCYLFTAEQSDNYVCVLESLQTAVCLERCVTAEVVEINVAVCCFSSWSWAVSSAGSQGKTHWLQISGALESRGSAGRPQPLRGYLI